MAAKNGNRVVVFWQRQKEDEALVLWYKKLVVTDLVILFSGFQKLRNWCHWCHWHPQKNVGVIGIHSVPVSDSHVGS